MMIIQIVLISFFVFALIKVFARLKSGELKSVAAIRWVVFWLAAIIIVVKPDISSQLAVVLGVGRGVDVIIYASIASLFFISFKIIVRLEKIENQITKLVRQDTLSQIKKYESPSHNS